MLKSFFLAPSSCLCHHLMLRLASGELEIQALEHATNLWEMVKQLEQGHVQWIRKKYSPWQGHAADQMWPRIKVTINHCERLYHQLMDLSEFNGDKKWFSNSSQPHIVC